MLRPIQRAGANRKPNRGREGAVAGFKPGAGGSAVVTILGGCSEGVTPVPIPNTEVKPLSPDGTAWVTAWESRTPPNYF